MNVRGRAMRTIWPAADGRTVEIIDQTRLPHELVIVALQTLDDAARDPLQQSDRSQNREGRISGEHVAQDPAARSSA